MLGSLVFGIYSIDTTKFFNDSYVILDEWKTLPKIKRKLRTAWIIKTLVCLA